MEENKKGYGPDLKFRGISVYGPPKYQGMFSRFRGDSAFNNPKNTTILQNVSGYVPQNTIYGIIGGSGSGKTTLLNVLSGYASSRLLICGKVKVDGKIVDVTSICGFVQQTDLFYSELTVMEYLIFQAYFRLGSKLNMSQIKAKCSELVCTYGLERCQNTRIKSNTSSSGGLSGGERRRLSVVAEIMDKPRLLFLDEISSGLDSFTAETIFEIIKALSQNGTTVICTIHQPSSYLFSLIDNILILSTGKVVYEGRREYAMEHFQRLDFPVPIDCNPAEHYIGVIEQLAANPGDSECSIDKFTDSVLLNQKYSKKFKHKLIKKNPNWFIGQDFHLNPVMQVAIILWRNLLINWRQKHNFFILAFQNAFFSLFYALTYKNQKYNVDTVINIAGALFFILANFSLSQCLSTVYTHTFHFSVYSREHRRNLYRSMSFYLAMFMGSFPSSIAMTVIVLNIYYWIIGLNPSLTVFFSYFGILLMMSQISVAFGMMISIVSRDIKVSVSVAGSLIVLFVVIGGYFINDSQVRSPLKVLRFISWTRYGYEAMMLLHYDRLLPCRNIVCILVNGGRPIKLESLQDLVGLRVNYLMIDIVGLWVLFGIIHALGITFMLLKTLYYER